MSSKTIAKIWAFVILVWASGFALLSCGLNTKSYAGKPANDLFTPPEVVGRISDPDIIEASGLTVSKCLPNVFWTHNDSGDEAFIYSVNSAGANLGTWRVAGAQNLDWEDIAEYKDQTGKCFIYIGEIGNNNLKQQVHTIYRIAEPQVSQSSSGTTRKNALETAPAEALTFTYTDTNQNAETLMVHPATGDIYVLSKNRSGPAGVYKIAPNFNTGVIQKISRLTDVQVPSVPVGLLTGGDISPDGRRVVLCDYLDGYELSLPDKDTNFDDIWRQPIVEIDLGKRDTGEAVAYAPDGNTIYATTEGRNAPIIEIRRK